MNYTGLDDTISKESSRDGMKGVTSAHVCPS